MRAASRLLASLKPSDLMQAGTPTGLCGLRTHPAPRSTLLYLYNSTLEKLGQLPESSVYRQSTEALTKHRLKIIEATKPKGWDAWQDRIQLVLADDPKGYKVPAFHYKREIILPKSYNQPMTTVKPEKPKREQPQDEGPRTQWERRNQAAKLSGADKGWNAEHEIRKQELDPEPMYTAEQVSYIESQIGAGLLEEVIQVAEGELKLVDTMTESKVWEDLAEKAPEGQWTYFERGGHTGETQKP